MTSVSGTLSCHLIFRSFLRQFKWKWLRLLAWRWCSVHVSHAYEMVGGQLVSSLIPLRSQTFPRRLPNATQVLSILAVTRSSICTATDRVLPTYVNEFINNLQSLTVHFDGWLNVGFSRYWLVRYLSLFRADLFIIVTVLYFPLCWGILCHVIGIEKLIKHVCLQLCSGLQPS